MKLIIPIITIIVLLLISGCIEPLKSTGKQAGTNLEEWSTNTINRLNATLVTHPEPQELIDIFCFSKKMKAGQQFVGQTISPSIVCYIKLETTNEYGTSEYSWNEYYVWKELNTVQTKTNIPN